MNERTVLIDSPQETLPYKISPVLSGSQHGAEILDTLYDRGLQAR